MKDIAAGFSKSEDGIVQKIEPPRYVVNDFSGVDIYWDIDQIKVNLESMRRHGDKFECIFSCYHKEYGTLKAPMRLNLLSSSALEGLSRQLYRRNRIDWAARLEQVVEVADSAYKRTDDLYWLGTEEPRAIAYLIRPVIEEHEICALAAEGGTGKSLVVEALAVSVARQIIVVPGLLPGRHAKTLVLDWETSKETYEARYRAILKGVGHPVAGPEIGYLRMHTVLAENGDAVTRKIRSEGFGLVIVDSVGPAIGGQIMNSDAAIPMLNLCRSWKTSVLLIGHVPKGNDDGKMIGTQAWFDQPRLSWTLKKVQEPGEQTSRLALIHGKANNSSMRSPIGLRVEFEGSIVGAEEKLIAVRYYSTEVQKDPALEQYANASDRISAHLLVVGRQQTSAIAEDLDMSINTVKKTLERGKGTRFVMWGSGRTADWGVLARSGTPGTTNRVQPGTSGALETNTYLVPDSPITKPPFKGFGGRSGVKGIGNISSGTSGTPPPVPDGAPEEEERW